jgi:hypothetical protein
MMLTAQPWVKFISVTQNDNIRFCQVAVGGKVMLTRPFINSAVILRFSIPKFPGGGGGGG